MEQAVYRGALKTSQRDQDYRDQDQDGAPVGFPPSDPLPLFLSAPSAAPEPAESLTGARHGRGRQVARLVTGGLLLGPAALLLLFSQTDLSRSLLGSAMASISSLGEQRIEHAKAGHVIDDNVFLPQSVQAEVSDSPKATIPSRDAIASAYRNALQNRVMLAAGNAAGIADVAATFVHEATRAEPPLLPKPLTTLDADTRALLMKRASGLLATGDINGARLFLERAANAQDASAALLLAQTYDPAALGVHDVRSVAPDLAMARDWYQKASRLGSLEAQQRLAGLGK